MKDIDFDELDRAVSSVLGQDKPVQPEAPAEKAVIDNGQKKSEVSEPVQPEPVVATNAITINPRPRTTGSRPSGPSLATIRRGKFMDVMHQTVQTQPSSQKPSVSPALKRELVALEPSKTTEDDLQELKKDPLENADDPVDKVSSVEYTTEPTAIVDESNSLIGAEPASVDTQLLEATSSDEDEHVTEKTEDVETKAEDELLEKASSQTFEDELAQMSEDATSPSSSSFASSAPQESPFLADTKVEKRPLGGFPEANQTEDQLAGSTDANDKKDVQSAPVVPVPRELEADIVKVEATQNEQEQAVASSPFSSSVAASAEPTDDGRVDGHPLFDTSTYHEPIAPVHHGGMPGWAKWLIGLLLCLALGAGVGYFLFTAGL